LFIHVLLQTGLGLFLFGRQLESFDERRRHDLAGL